MWGRVADAEWAIPQRFDGAVSGPLRYWPVMKMVGLMEKDIVSHSRQEKAGFIIPSREVELGDRVPEHSGSQRRSAPWVEVAEEEDENGQFQKEPARQ